MQEPAMQLSPPTIRRDNDRLERLLLGGLRLAMTGCRCPQEEKEGAQNHDGYGQQPFRALGRVSGPGLNARL